MRRIDVAIGLLLRNGRVLICQRSASDAFGGLWEFPGGKCRPGETPQICLTRELLEELQVQVQPGEALPSIEHDYPDLSVRLFPFLCEAIEGQPQALASQQLRWVSPAALRDHSFPAANAELIERVIRRLEGD